MSISLNQVYFDDMICLAAHFLTPLVPLQYFPPYDQTVGDLSIPEVCSVIYTVLRDKYLPSPKSGGLVKNRIRYLQIVAVSTFYWCYGWKAYRNF